MDEHTPGGELLSVARESRCSVEVTRNAKGDYQWSIKAYHEDGYENAAVHRIKWVDCRLRAWFLHDAKALDDLDLLSEGAEQEYLPLNGHAGSGGVVR